MHLNLAELIQEAIKRETERMAEFIQTFEEQLAESRKPSQDDLREIFEGIRAEADPVAFLMARQEFINKYGPEEWHKQMALAIRRG